MKKKAVAAILLMCLITGILTSCGGEKAVKPDDSETEKPASGVVFDTPAQKASKTETVYVNLDYSGNVTKINVSDWLHTDENNVFIDDTSDLKDITNLKSDTEPVANGDKLRWNMNETDLYYSGVSDKSLPIKFDISYKLNGKEIDAEKIAGKDGDVEITVKVSNTEYKDVIIEGKKHRVYLPLIVAGGMILPETGFSAVETVNGQSIGDGSKEICIFIGMPGFSESLGISESEINELGGLSIGDTFTIKAKAENFALGNMYFAALPIGSLNFDLVMPENMDDLKSTFAALKAFENTLNSVDPDKVLLGLLSDEKKVTDITNALTSAMTLYSGNKELLSVLGKYATPENFEKLKSLMDKLSDPEMQSALETLTDPKIMRFFKKLPELSKDFEEISPVITSLQNDLDDPVVAKEVENLPETLTALKEITKVLNENSDSLDVIARILNEDGTEVLQSLIKSLDLSSLSVLGAKYGDLAANGDLLISLAEQWLEFGKSYGLYSQFSEGMDTSLAFVFNTPSVKKSSDSTLSEPVTEALPWYKKLFSR